jgi:hypothetical protein
MRWPPGSEGHQAGQYHAHCDARGQLIGVGRTGREFQCIERVDYGHGARIIARSDQLPPPGERLPGAGSRVMARPQDYYPEQEKAAGIEPMRKAAKLLIGSGTGCALKYDAFSLKDLERRFNRAKWLKTDLGVMDFVRRVRRGGFWRGQLHRYLEPRELFFQSPAV